MAELKMFYRVAYIFLTDLTIITNLTILLLLLLQTRISYSYPILVVCVKWESNKGHGNMLRKENKGQDSKKKDNSKNEIIREVPQVPSSLFFKYNTALAPPYSILVDTNFISHTIQHKLEVIPTMMDCLYAKCTPVVTDCVLAELEKLGQKYRLALRVAKDPRFERVRCDHKGTYADDCLVDRVIKHRIYIVATNDRDLKRRVRKIPGVPIMSVARGKYVIERLPDAPEK